MALSRIFRVWRHRVIAVSKKDRLDTQLSQELTFHFEQLVGEHIAAGMSPEAAQREARRALGNLSLLEDECRD
jgi:hypothetical protein